MGKSPEYFEKTDKVVLVLTNVLSGIAGIMMALLTMFVFAEVLCRYVFKAPIVITSEMTSILFPWIVMLSAISIAKNEQNTALVLFRNKFRGIYKHVVEIAIYLITLYFSTFMTIASFNLCMSLRREILALTRVSKAFTYGSMVIGFTGISLVVAYNMIKYIMIEINKDEEVRR